ncbi:hypothetical protein [Escherichia coli]|uniref:hypothetical protein n=1 Tax=Escherichia coli TaxID=562 RepID=UPI0018F83A8C|nr:hypothetical protein [Escherichia coli]
MNKSKTPFVGRKRGFVFPDSGKVKGESVFDFSKLIREIRMMAEKLSTEVHPYLAGVCDYGFRLFHWSDTLVVK